MRHADIKTTMNTYGSAFEKTKRRANSRVADLVLPPAIKKQLKDRAKEVSLKNEARNSHDPVILELGTTPVVPQIRKWLRGVDLNHRPLGYESKNTIVFNNLQDAGGPRKAL